MNEPLTVTGAIVAVAVAAAVVSAPSIINHAGSHPISPIPAPTSLFPTSGPLAVIASPALAPPLPAATGSPVASTPRPAVGPSAARTAPAIGTSEPAPPSNPPATVPASTCLIGLVLDPLLGICVG